MSDYPVCQRKSPRLQGYNYSQEGAYFLTICTQHRLHLFGTVQNQTMILNPAGKMVNELWLQLPNKFSNLELDYFVVMPNHFHGILIVNNIKIATSTSIINAVQWFKTITTNGYIRGVKTDNWESFPGKVWQRSFHDHIIRNEQSLNRFREYIINNPALWQKDTFYS